MQEAIRPDDGSRGRAEEADLWTFKPAIRDPSVLEGMELAARDGTAGKIEEAVVSVGASYIVVATDRWVYGKKVFLPAGAIERVDASKGTAYVNLTQDQIEGSPEFDRESDEPSYVDLVASYYSPIMLPKP